MLWGATEVVEWRISDSEYIKLLKRIFIDDGL
jgi:hypothetical protein